MAKRFSSFILLLFVLSFKGFSQDSFPVDSIRLIGEVQIKPKTEIKGTVFGGISGIDRGDNGEYYLISDDKSSFSPARFYKAEFFYDQNKFDSVSIKSVRFLKDKDAQVFEKYTVDPESIRYYKGNLYWTSEGDRRRGIQPLIRIADTSGNYIGNIPLNPAFQYYPKEYGLRENLAFEGSSFLENTDTYWVANEAPLYQDGRVPQLYETQSPIRFSFIDTYSGRIKKQYAYLLDKVKQASTKPNGEQMNSSPEILAVSSHQLLVLERGYSESVGTTVKLYKADLNGATDIKRKKSLVHTAYNPASKQLLLNFSKIGLPYIDNIEGMTFGHRLPNGNPSLIFVADDNFSEREVTQFIVFEVVLKK